MCFMPEYVFLKFQGNQFKTSEETAEEGTCQMLIWVWGRNTPKAVQKEYMQKGEVSVKIACILKRTGLVEAVTSL